MPVFELINHRGFSSMFIGLNVLKKPLVPLFCCSNVRAVSGRLCDLKVLWVPCFRYRCFGTIKTWPGRSGHVIRTAVRSVTDCAGQHWFHRYNSVVLSIWPCTHDEDRDVDVVNHKMSKIYKGERNKREKNINSKMTMKKL